MAKHSKDSVFEELLAPLPRAPAGTSSASTQRFSSGSLVASRHGPASDRSPAASPSVAAFSCDADSEGYDDEGGSEAEAIKVRRHWTAPRILPRRNSLRSLMECHLGDKVTCRRTHILSRCIKENTRFSQRQAVMSLRTKSCS